MQKFDAIRPFYDSEINEALHNIVNHPMMKALMNFSFPGVADEVWKEQLRKTHLSEWHTYSKVFSKSVERRTKRATTGATE